MLLHQPALPHETKKLLEMYLQLPFDQLTVMCPYWMNKLEPNIKGPFSGKGTPKQIVYATKLLARKQRVNLQKLTYKQILNFMKKNRIGVDCSGLVFHLANCFDKETGGTGIANKLLENNKLPSWRAAWRVNANRLTDPEYTTEVSLANVRVGDMIRVMGGKHVFFVVEVVKNTIVYVHSSFLSTKESGVHLSKIKIINRQKDLSYQQWYEKTLDGKNYGKQHFNKNAGDSIRRFKWMPPTQ